MFSFLKSGWRWLKKQCRKLVSEVKDTVVGTGKNKVRKEDSLPLKLWKYFRNTVSAISDVRNKFKLCKKVFTVVVDGLKIFNKVYA
ncbi:TPA: hypothetical protein JG993_004841 [Vibrio parahaemolyticus]|uniref:Transposase n=1 Tax=Vibrio jasicida TaxID=766224 RepID=A0AAU9R1U6_9VIBR|nr:hypothetical protein THF1C08_840008 [Vibrio jasicida]CAH1603877.1 hypothetical protein THF1A12_860008 [Vibrio jasicida]HAV1416016.1 hypothetical protein [Vibrio parahaemolyticus]HAV2008816.1 hypothetical protein [Vibrio parahaemolyticus]